MTVSESLPGSVAPDSFLLAEMTKTVLELQTAATAMAFVSILIFPKYYAKPSDIQKMC